MGNGQFLVGNLRETEISISPLGDYGSAFPQNFPNKKCGEISSFFAVEELTTGVQQLARLLFK